MYVHCAALNFLSNNFFKQLTFLTVYFPHPPQPEKGDRSHCVFAMLTKANVINLHICVCMCVCTIYARMPMHTNTPTTRTTIIETSMITCRLWHPYTCCLCTLLREFYLLFSVSVFQETGSA